MAAAVVEVISMLSLYYAISLSSANLLRCGSCFCPEGILVFSCSVNGGGATVWKGSVFNCHGNNRNEITLRHSEFDNGVSEATGSCNDGNIVAYNIDVTNNIYSSQLNVTISPEMHNETVECIQYRVNSTSVTVGAYTLILNATGTCKDVIIMTIIILQY